MSASSTRRVAVVAAVVSIASVVLLIVPPAAHAQTEPGAARGVGEAPGAPLANEPRRAEDRSRGPSMAFAEGTGECRETVPGGKMLAIAYALFVAFLGGYVMIVARKASSLARSVEQLEADIARRAGPRPDSEDVA